MGLRPELIAKERVVPDAQLLDPNWLVRVMRLLLIVQAVPVTAVLEKHPLIELRVQLDVLVNLKKESVVGNWIVITEVDNNLVYVLKEIRKAVVSYTVLSDTSVMDTEDKLPAVKSPAVNYKLDVS